jgi:hypothetical protein
VTNSQEQARVFEIRLEGDSGLRIDSATRIEVEAAGMHAIPLRLVLPAEQAASHAGQTLDLSLQVTPVDGLGDRSARLPARFIVPR